MAIGNALDRLSKLVYHNLKSVSQPVIESYISKHNSKSYNRVNKIPEKFYDGIENEIGGRLIEKMAKFAPKDA